MVDLIAFSLSRSDLEPILVKENDGKNSSINWIKSITSAELDTGKNKV